MLKRLLPCLIFLVPLVMASYASASPSYDKIHAEYPRDKYLVGVGETGSTGNFLNDRRVAEVLARLEIAKQIKVRLREETLDIMCEGGSARLFKDILECKNQFIMIVEVTVDEFLEGSRIARHGETDGIVYAVAIMPREEAARKLDNRAKESLDSARQSIEKAKKGDQEALNEAREEYMKAVTYDKEKEMIEGVKSRAADMFDELEDELMKLKEKK